MLAFRAAFSLGGAFLLSNALSASYSSGKPMEAYMDMDAIRTFLAIAQHGSFSGAAETLQRLLSKRREQIGGVDVKVNQLGGGVDATRADIGEQSLSLYVRY
jgi:hypothetical protein